MPTKPAAKKCITAWCIIFGAMIVFCFAILFGCSLADLLSLRTRFPTNVRNSPARFCGRLCSVSDCRMVMRLASLPQQ